MTEPRRPDWTGGSGSADAVFEAAVAAHEAGRLEEADWLYREVIRLDPTDAAAHELLGQVLISRDDHAGATAMLRRATELDAGSWGAWLSLSVAAAETGDGELARNACRRALDLAGGETAVRVQWAMLEAGRGAIDEAVAAAFEILRDGGREPVQLRVLAGIARKSGRIDLLAAVAEHLDELTQEEFDDLLRRAQVCWSAGRMEQLDRLLRLLHAHRPSAPQVACNLAARLKGQRRLPEAVEVLERCLANGATDPDLVLMLAGLRSDLGDDEGARRLLDRRREGRSGDPAWRLAECATRLKACYRSEDEVREALGAVDRGLRELDASMRGLDASSAGPMLEAILRASFFRLPATGEDVRRPAESLGRIVARVVGALAPSSMTPPAASGARRIRVGLLSAFFRTHSNWRTHLCWLSRLDRGRFEVIGYSTRPSADPERDEARRRCEHFVELTGHPLAVIERLRADRLDAVVVPEVGMDPVTLVAASARLARVQCSSWGHPVTSGFASCGWFLSSEGMEPPDGDAKYSERLVRLPGLGMTLDAPAWTAAPAPRERVEVARDEVAYWCSQALHKYLPRHDHLFAELAGRCPRAVFVFIGPDDHVRACLADRVGRSLREAGLDPGRHLRWLDPVGTRDFVELGGACDVFLDCPAWSGCNTTLDALAMGLPIVTLPGTTMRARHTSAMLEQMDLGDLVARDEEGFVELASRLGRDAELRRHARERIVERRERLFGDRRPIEAVERLLEEASKADGGRIA